MKSSMLLAVALAALCILPACKKESASKPAAPAKTTEVARTAEGEWCAEHGVPESICTRCNSKLVAEFKQKGDWCETHKLPKTQCLDCDPSLKAKFEAMAPKS